MNPEGILVTGARRSGTMLMHRLLDGHEALSVLLNESYFFEYLSGLSESESETFVDYFFSGEIGTVIDDLIERQLLPHYGTPLRQPDGYANTDVHEISFDTIRFTEILGQNRNSFPKTLQGIWCGWNDAIQELLTPEAGLHPVVFKCADFGVSANKVTDLFQDLQIIFLVRHPIQALNSVRKLRQGQNRSGGLTTVRLLEEISRYHGYLETIKRISEFKGRALVVRYEDLVERPEKTMQLVAEFIGIECDENLLRPTLHGQPYKGDSAFEPLTGISKAPLNSRKLILSHAEIDMIRFTLQDYMNFFGYEG